MSLPDQMIQNEKLVCVASHYTTFLQETGLGKTNAKANLHVNSFQQFGRLQVICLPR